MAAKKRKTLTLPAKRKTAKPRPANDSLRKAIAALHAEHRTDVARIVERLDAISGATPSDVTEAEENPT